MNPTYQYTGLEQATQPGLSVETCAARLQCLAYAEERLMFQQAAHIVSVPERDVKVSLARWQYEDSLHADQLKARLPELRMSKKRAYDPPDTALKIVFDEALHAGGTVELLAGLAHVFKPALLAAYRRYLAETNHLADYPTVRLLKTIINEEEEAQRLLAAAFTDLADTPQKVALAEQWAAHLQTLLAAAGGVDGTGQGREADLNPSRSQSPYQIPRRLSRDKTFPRVWDFMHVENERVSERLAQMVSTRLSEVTVAEGLALVLCETEGQPWAFYVDISRHLWDEMRHSLFGEAAAEDLLGDRSGMPVRDFEAEYVFQMSPLELYAMLGIGVEAALMKYPPGKREEFEFCRDLAGHPLMTTFQDFDWADEVLHVNIARRQLKDWFKGNQAELIALAQKGLDFRAETRRKQAQAPLPSLSRKTG